MRCYCKWKCFGWQTAILSTPAKKSRSFKSSSASPELGKGCSLFLPLWQIIFAYTSKDISYFFFLPYCNCHFQSNLYSLNQKRSDLAENQNKMISIDNLRRTKESPNKVRTWDWDKLKLSVITMMIKSYTIMDYYQY